MVQRETATRAGDQEDAMYTTIRQYKVPDPATVDEIVRRITEGFGPLISQAPGFVAWYLVHRERDVLMSFSVFAEQAEAEDSTTVAADWVRHQLGDLLPNPPLVTGGTVAAHRVK